MMSPIEWCMTLGFFFSLGCMGGLVVGVYIFKKWGWIL